MSSTSIETSSSISSLVEEFNVITHNLANVSTTGYKRRCTAFSKVLEAAQSGSDQTSQINIDKVFDFSQGNLIQTSRPLDVALSGKAFFVIETPEGPLYSRNGTFVTNKNGQIVDSLGRTVAGQAGPITIPPDVTISELYISEDGAINSDGFTFGKFKIVDFGPDESKLESVGDSCFKMTDQTVTPVNAQNVAAKQGYQESSNVTMIEELVNMIMVSRLYEANIKAMSAQSEASDSLLVVARA
ncbi:MAG: flagellar hook-basal body protein [Planctomycetota bacterium]|jgi:flagellar basal body rod protein FlgG